MIITFPISIKAIVIGKAITGVIYYYMNALMIGRLYNFGFFKQIVASWKYILSTVIMGILITIIISFINSNLISLIIGILAGILIYALLLFILKDDEFLNLFNKILRKFNIIK